MERTEKEIMEQTRKKLEEFRDEVEKLVNTLSLENLSDTPDFIIAQYITECLIAYNRAFYSQRIRENGGSYEKIPLTY